MTGADVIKWCRLLSIFTDEPGFTTRTFLSEPMHAVHAALREWMEQLGMTVEVDAAGNLRGQLGTGPRLLIGSHLDTVPRAGAFDGILGVVLGLALLTNRQGKPPLPFAVEVIGFSEEEGVRYGFPFIGSRGFLGTLEADQIAQASEAIIEFGLTPPVAGQPLMGEPPVAFLEFHIEQGPGLDSRQQPLAIVDSIVGQSRWMARFEGEANHAGTTPMRLRHDALAGAAEWVLQVEEIARNSDGLVATVGKFDVVPGAGNIVPGQVSASLDVRHASDAAREAAVTTLLAAGEGIAARRGLRFSAEQKLSQAATPMDAGLRATLSESVRRAGYEVVHLDSGAGHDAMILAPVIPSAMLFLRSPGGLSHHPEEAVREEDIDAALAVGEQFLELFHA